MIVVVGKFGEPDRFTMFMCNLNWPEITSKSYSRKKLKSKLILCGLYSA